MATVLVTGGAGYVGAVLVPRLLAAGRRVKVIDLYMLGRDILGSARRDAALEEHVGDIRDQELLKRVLPGCDAVIHLACISNDPSFELNPELGKSINFDAFEPLVRISKESGVRRFIYSSTSSVYGVSDRPEVTEDTELEPLTDYSKYKALCEPILLKYQSPDFTTVIIRPATVCGFSPRQRLDLVVNILTNHAVNSGKIKVLGGAQLRPNIHIADIVDLYVRMLEYPEHMIAGKTFNAGFENHSVAELAQIVKQVDQAEMPGREVIEIETVSTNDNRSYRINSDKIRRELGWESRFTIQDGVRELVAAFRDGKLPDAMTRDSYYNMKTMQKLGLK